VDASIIGGRVACRKRSVGLLVDQRRGGSRIASGPAERTGAASWRAAAASFASYAAGARDRENSLRLRCDHQPFIVLLLSSLLSVSRVNAAAVRAFRSRAMAMTKRTR
jgi:hypothetical protein